MSGLSLEPGDRRDDEVGPGGSTDGEHGRGAHRDRRWLVRAFLEADLVVLAMAAAGVLGGWLWHRWWAPAPDGVIGIPTTGEQVKQWFPMPYEAGERDVFTATAEFVVVAVALALVVGVVAALLARRSWLVTFLALLVGAAVAAFVMYRLGASLGPPDPDLRAASLQPGDTLPGSLSIAGWTPYLSWPIGALLGFALANLGAHGVGRLREKGDDPGWLRSGATSRGSASSDGEPTATPAPPPSG